MTDTKLFASPAEAAACLRECLDVWAPDITVKERAALESLEAEVGRLHALNSSNAEVASRTIDRVVSDNREQAARIRALESELAAAGEALGAVCVVGTLAGLTGDEWEETSEQLERHPHAAVRAAMELRATSGSWYARCRQLESELAEKTARVAELDIRRRESRVLLHRFVKYVREDRAETPGVTRLARLTDQVADYLARTSDPDDVLRTFDPAARDRGEASPGEFERALNTVLEFAQRRTLLPLPSAVREALRTAAALEERLPALPDGPVKES